MRHLHNRQALDIITAPSDCAGESLLEAARQLEAEIAPLGDCPVKRMGEQIVAYWREYAVAEAKR